MYRKPQRGCGGQCRIPSTREPPLPLQPPTSEFQAGAVQAPNQVSVRFGASQLSRKLNGIYQKVVGATSAGRPLYNRGQKYLMYLADGTWAIKDGPEADVDADVYAYVKDDAHEPYNVQRPWQVPADGDGFVADSKTAVTPGRSDHAEAAAKAVKKQVQSSMPRGGRQPGAMAEAAMDKREASERWQKEAKENGVPRIRVTIVSASCLASSDVFGKSDPFIVCKVPGKQIAKFETPHINDTTDPRWDHQEEVIGWEVGDTLQFSVYDKDTGSASDLLGVTALESSDFWPDGFDGELVLDGTAKGVISKLRLRVFVLERGKPGFVKVELPSPAPRVSRRAAAPSAAEAAGVGDLDDYEEEWDEEWEEQELFAERHRVQEQIRQQQEELLEESDEDLMDMNDEELQVYRAVFEKVDTDGSGKIDLEELQDNIEIMGVQVTAKELKQLALHVDKDQDGIDFDEFLDLVQHFHDLEVLNLKKTFAQFDRDRSGTIDMEEAFKVFQEAGAALSDAEIRGLMKDADVNEDGVVDFHEFVHLMTVIRHDATAHKEKGQEEHEIEAQQAQKKITLAPSDLKRVKGYLKRKGFDPEDVNSQRKTGTGFSKKGFESPLHTAAAENLSDMVWLLLESKANPIAQNSSAQTPMDIAVKGDKKGSHKAVMEHLNSYIKDNEVKCVDCGHPLASDERFCRECGRKVEDVEEEEKL